MHTLSSASLTCIASSSAVEWTATVWMPSSRQARMTRRAISPRLAMSILSNIALFNQHKSFAILDGAPVLHINLGDLAVTGRWDLFDRLHVLDDENSLSGLQLGPGLDEMGSPRLRRPV